ncbi:MAG: hypothetical protein UY40_C0010G0002 [candidate division CPR1 bacterium GW2011_GWC1_49_13]|uniref:NAD-dependent epimerase/dehydratase domain-containing protein n=1 Tax=candidate division CPR1 bacterium GW2011_GWC1_49_13 TaxID=1618342 RepID=A0A0G1VHJ7_9BACT|nr:MAG: hypothetical protein UY40_C0010G0002 [candidate division CPR1 bacterium GW2011_GWC1_49_13]
MANDKKEVLLSYAPDYLIQALKPLLEKQGFTVTLHREGLPPKKSFSLIIHAPRDAAILAEWTRELLNKAQADKSRFFLIRFRTADKLYEEAAGFAQSLIKNAAQNQEVAAFTLSLGRLYGPRVPAEESGALGYLLKEFAEKEFLTLYGDGKDQDYYLYLADGAQGITQALNTPHLSHATSLTSPLPVASETVAKMLFDLGGGRHEIRYHRGIAADEEQGPPPGTPLTKFKALTSFQDGVMAALKEETPLLKAKFPRLSLPSLKVKDWSAKPKQKEEAAPARKFTPPGKRSLILAALLLPLLYLAGETGWAAYNLQKAKNSLLNFDFPAAQTAFHRSSGSLGRLGVVVPPLKIAADLSETAANVSATAPTLSRALENLQKSYQGEAITPQTEEEFKSLNSSVDTASQDLTVAWLNLQDLSPLLRGYTDKYANLIQEEALPALSFLTALADQGYDLLGYQGERNYLLLFENSAELQPGGGRMGTFANLKLQSGAVKELKFFNESDFKHISSPLGKFNNISKFVDFRDGARAIADIFLRGDKTPTQGVVGVDLRIAQELLRITGPLTLADFGNQEVTAENFFEVTTREVETEFFPGTTKKKRFIQALGEGVLQKLFSTGKESYGSLSQVVWDGLREKRLLLYFTNPTLYLPALENNFAGRVADAEGDYLYPFDHNSGTKGTVWVKRKIAYRVFNTNREGALRGELKVTWKNEGTEAWPVGNHRNKTSVLIPHGATFLTELRSSSGEKKLQNFKIGAFSGKTNIFLNYDVTRYITVPPQEEETLTLLYDLPQNLNVKTSPYRLYLQKQPGTVADEVEFIFEIPFGYAATPTAVPAGFSLQSEENKLILRGNLKTDIEFLIELKER